MSVPGYATNRNAMTSFHDKAVLLYIDNEKNLQNNNDAPGTSECTKCQYYLVAAAIDKNGTISRTPVNIEAESSGGFLPDITNIDDKSFYFYFSRTKANMIQYLSTFIIYKMIIKEK